MAFGRLWNSELCFSVCAVGPRFVLNSCLINAGGGRHRSLLSLSTSSSNGLNEGLMEESPSVKTGSIVFLRDSWISGINVCSATYLSRQLHGVGVVQWEGLCFSCPSCQSADHKTVRVL